MMQRNPTWQVGVSTACAIRAAGRLCWQQFCAQRDEPPLMMLRAIGTGVVVASLWLTSAPVTSKPAQHEWPILSYACALRINWAEVIGVQSGMLAAEGFAPGKACMPVELRCKA
jgi:hypothetical protein